MERIQRTLARIRGEPTVGTVILGKMSDVLDEHTLAATEHRYVLRTGERVHECFGACAADIVMRLEQRGVRLVDTRASGISEGTDVTEQTPQARRGSSGKAQRARRGTAGDHRQRSGRALEARAGT